MAEDQQAGIYTIGAVARMLGVESATLRNWEERFKLVRPERSRGGQRLFSRDDLERLRFVAERVAEGMSAGQAHRLLAEHVGEGRSLLDDVFDAPPLLVLLLERDRLAAELTEFFLRTEGCEVVPVFAVPEALERFEELAPQLVILDLLIPAGDGLELCRELKRRGVVALLALSTLATMEAALEAGADAFLRKPVDPLRLVSTVKDLLGTSALGRPVREHAHG